MKFIAATARKTARSDAPGRRTSNSDVTGLGKGCRHPTRGKSIASLRVRFSVAAVSWWAFENCDFAARSSNSSRNRGSHDSETVVVVFELWRNTRSRGSAGNLYVMPPGATSRRSTASVGRPLRISFGRVTVVPGVVPVDTPLMHVVTQIVKPVSVGRIETYWLGPALPTPGVIEKMLGRCIAPRVG